MSKINEAIKKEYSNCHICPRNCGINRLIGEKGFCGVGKDSKVFNTTVLVNENDEIAPTYAIYLTGCNLNCQFCSVAKENASVKISSLQVAEIPNPKDQIPNNFPIPVYKTKNYSNYDKVDEKFIRKIKNEIGMVKPKTISFIGGEPIVHLLTIFKLIEKLKPQIPLVFYTNLFFNPQIGQILGAFFQYVIADVHFGNNECAEMIAEIKDTRLNTEKENTKTITDYWEIVSRNIIQLKEWLILRHLLLPGHIDCCYKKIIDWMSKEIPHKPLWLLTNYFPYTSKNGLNRRIRASEVKSALDYARKKGIIIKMLNLLKPRRKKAGCLSYNQEIVIDEEGSVAFKYLDGIALEMARLISQTR